MAYVVLMLNFGTQNLNESSHQYSIYNEIAILNGHTAGIVDDGRYTGYPPVVIW